MYDLSSLWATSQLSPQKMRIVVINNNGGQIFSRMFKKEIFINKHQISFESWAKMWNWSYQQWHTVPTTMELADHQIIELCPNAEQTQLFWKELEALWKE
jgi:2-succinyl-5-enolpyruvyl-6-hydroxy-3-cyclohexene-1-carboxylate synthase